MADVNKNVSVSFKAIDNMTKTVNAMKQDLQALGNETKKLTKGQDETAKSTKGMGAAMFKANILSEAFFSALNLGVGVVKRIGDGIVAFGRNVVVYMGDASRAAQEFDLRLGGLNIIAGRLGVSGKAAQKAAKDLGSELRIGVNSAAGALQKLMMSGLSLDQAAELLRRFTNEAITGKSAHISLAEAVENLAFAYQTSNSTLGNMSGIQENFDTTILPRGKAALEAYLKSNKTWLKQNPMLAKQVADYGKQLKAKGIALNLNNREQQKYIGMLATTNITLGSAKTLTTDLMSAQSRLSVMATDLKINIGQGLNVALSWLAEKTMPTLEQGFSGLMTWIDRVKGNFQSWWANNQKFIQPQLNIIATAINNVKLKLQEWLAPLGNSQASFDTFANTALKNVVNKIEEIAGKMMTFIDWIQKDSTKTALADFGKKFVEVADSVYNIVVNIDKVIAKILELKKVAEGMRKGSIGGVIGSTIGGIIEKMKGSNNASGTSFFSGGVAQVGEMGRENVVLPRGTKILNNKKSSGPQGITVNVNAPVYGVDNLVATITSAVTQAQARQNQLAGYGLL